MSRPVRLHDRVTWRDKRWAIIGEVRRPSGRAFLVSRDGMLPGEEIAPELFAAAVWSHRDGWVVPVAVPAEVAP